MECAIINMCSRYC